VRKDWELRYGVFQIVIFSMLLKNQDWGWILKTFGGALSIMFETEQMREKKKVILIRCQPKYILPTKSPLS